ncbi:hypothetical protein BD560DRAFT_422152 [Blakeslea trispora]|nr:hypothetical protein BD560DRAFT_422152 [Blakeslea trispora]
MSNLKTCAQQRASLRPFKYNTSYDERNKRDGREDDDSIHDDDTIGSSFESDSQKYNSGISQDSRAETMVLAEFLSTTCPEQYIRDHTAENKEQPQQQQYFARTTRLLNKLRKKSVHSNPTLNLPKKNHVPLCVPYEDQTFRSVSSTATTIMATSDSSFGHSDFTNKPTPTIYKKPSSQFPLRRQSSYTQTSAMRDSGVYSETASDKDFNPTVSYGAPPLPQFASVLNDLNFPQPPKTMTTGDQVPRRPAPLPQAVASAVIANAIRSVPEAALKRRSVRLRHVQVQTIDLSESPPIQSEKTACPHCRQEITPKSQTRSRRPSCPPALETGPVLKPVEPEPMEDAKALLDMIMKLKSQLEEEKQCRLKLEEAIYNRQPQLIKAGGYNTRLTYQTRSFFSTCSIVSKCNVLCCYKHNYVIKFKLSHSQVKLDKDVSLVVEMSN